jgi:hypothetical protein
MEFEIIDKYFNNKLTKSCNLNPNIAKLINNKNKKSN